MNHGRIHVFGGANGIGRWFIEKIFVNHLASVCVYDIDQSALERLPVQVQRVSLTSDTDYQQLSQGISTGDWIAFTLPVHIFPDVVSSLCQHLPSGCLLLDFSSVKEGPLQTLQSFASPDTEILGVHPLFGPLISSPVGQIVAFTPVTTHPVQTKYFRELLETSGLLVSEVSAAEHDEAMAFVQALTHFAYLSFAKAIVSDGQSFADLAKLRTPPFHFLSAFAGRILSGSPATYVNIQRTPAAKRVRRALIESAMQLDAAFDANDLQVGISAFEEIRKPLAGSAISECTSISRLATDTLERFEHQLHRLRQKRDIVMFRNSENNMLHIGRIESVGTDSVVVSEPFKKIITPEGLRYAIALNDCAISNYRRMGIEFGKAPTNVFMKRKMLFLSQSEQETWLQENLLLLKRSATFIKSGTFEPLALEHLILRFVKHVYSVTFLDLYRRRGTPENLTLEIEFRPDIGFDQIRNDIQEFIGIFRSSAEMDYMYEPMQSDSYDYDKEENQKEYNLLGSI